MTQRLRGWLIAGTVVLMAWGGVARAQQKKNSADFERQVQPVLRKYCVGCHGPEEANGELRLDSWEALMAGGEDGKVVVAGRPDESLLLTVLEPDAENHMPPEDEPQPSAADVALLRRWVASGARRGRPVAMKDLDVPKASPAPVAAPIVSIAVRSDGSRVVQGRVGEIVELALSNAKPVHRWHTELPHKIQAVAFAGGDRWLVAAGGIPGLAGRVWIWDRDTRKSIAKLALHEDAIDALAVDASGRIAATGGHDRVIRIWELPTGRVVKELSGHNGGVFALAFHPDGKHLASASADETVKVWDVVKGERIDTLGQPQGEQYAVAYSPDGRWLAAGGADNRLRIWRVPESGKELHELVVTRYGHERPIVQLGFSPDGTLLFTSGEDRTIKVWETKNVQEVAVLADQSDVASAVAWLSNRSLAIGRLDGSFEDTDIRVSAPRQTEGPKSPKHIAKTTKKEPGDVSSIDEREPNDAMESATEMALPAVVKGRLHGEEGRPDVDWYRFRASRGETWVFETIAAREGSPADTFLAVFDAKGHPVPRVRLQAIRDSHITFRGIDSRSIDVRLQHWEEMDLNQYVYLNGEVVRLFLYPRGPDSGFQLDHHNNRRITFFETTATAHALHEPCYVVEPVPEGVSPVPNGLPVFQLYYENDDDREGRWKGDSYLTFRVPKDGTYYVRVTDVRGLSGESFRYRLAARRPEPSFRPSITMSKKTVNAGSGKEFEVAVDRMDGFDGPVQFEISGFPKDWYVTTPLVIERERFVARGCVMALPEAKPLTEEERKRIRVVAQADINGRTVTQDVSGLRDLKLGPAPKLRVALGPVDGEVPRSLAGRDHFPEPAELVIHPGETIRARLRVERAGYHGRVQFESLKLNLPHGVYIDNIGLNGVLIPEGEDERIVFITAAPWVSPSRRLVFLRAQQEGTQTSFPIWLRVE